MQAFQNLIPCNLACLAIAALYYSWRDVYLRRSHVREMLREREVLRERVARLLWAAANENAPA